MNELSSTAEYERRVRNVHASGVLNPLLLSALIDWVIGEGYDKHVKPGPLITLGLLIQSIFGCGGCNERDK